MASVNTNAAAITALRTLQNTQASMDKTQAHISTGYKIGEAKDNAAYWAISTTLKSDNKSLGTVKDALGLGSSTVDTAYQGLNKAKDVLDEIKSKLTAATQDGVNRDTIQNEIKQLQDQLKSIATSSIFSGENWLSTDSSASSYNANKQIVASFSRDANGSISIGNIGVNISNVALFDASTVAGKDGILDSSQLLKDRDGIVLAYGGTADTSGNTNAAGLAAAAGTSNSGPVGAANGMNTALVTGAVAGAASAGTAGAALGASAGVASTRTEGANFAAITGMANGTAATDKLNIAMVIDGVAKTVSVSNAGGVGSITLQNIVDAINATAGANSYGPGVASIDTSGGGSKLKLTGGTAGATLNTGITGLTFTGATGTPVFTGLTVSTTTGTPSAATSGKLSSNLSNTGLADGDVITVTYSLGAPAGGTATRDITVTTASTFDKAAFAAAWNAGTPPAGVTVAAGSGTAVDFTQSGVTGTGSNFTLNNVVVKSSAATGSVIKNIDPLAGITGAKAQSVKTAVLTWPSTLASTDLVKVKMSGNATVFSAAAGTSLTDFVNNLNTSFGGAFTASKTTAGELVITASTTGTGQTVQVENTAITDATGTAKSVATTGLGLFATAATATTGAFSTFTLDGNDTLDLSVQIGTGAVKKVSIDQSLVNSTLGAAANGTVDTVANFKRVVDAALLKANVTGVTTAAGGSTLTFTGSLGQSLTIGGGTASQGAQTMSVDKINISTSGLAAVGATTSTQIKDVLTAYIDVVNSAINKVTSAAASLGSVASRIDMQKDFVNTLMDTIDKGVGTLIDADMSEESTRLQALQVKQQLGVQALSIANQSAQNILSLFK